MILGILDFETTGTDTLQDRATEVGMIMYSTGRKRIVEASSFLIPTTPERRISAEVKEKTGLDDATCQRFGYEDHDSLIGLLDWLKKVDAVAGHNILQFDWPLLQNWAVRHKHEHDFPSVYGQDPVPTVFGPNLLLIDTMWDLPGVRGRELQHMAADDGFLNMFPHGALCDCLTVLKLIENRWSLIDQIVERAKSPLIVLESLQKFENNEQAKDRKAAWNKIGGPFHWNDEPGHLWWKAVKEIDVEGIAKQAPFDVTIRRDLNLKELWS